MSEKVQRVVVSLVRAANKAAKAAHAADETDRKFTDLMREVFGDFDQLPDGIVEAVRYGHEQNGITWEFLKQEMADDLKLSKPETFPKRHNNRIRRTAAIIRLKEANENKPT